MIYSAPVCASLVDAATSLKRVVVLFYLSFTIFCAFEKFRLPTMSYIKPRSADGVTPTMNCSSGLYEVSREHLSFRKRLSALRLADSRVLLLGFVWYVLVYFARSRWLTAGGPRHLSSSWPLSHAPRFMSPAWEEEGLPESSLSSWWPGGRTAWPLCGLEASILLILAPLRMLKSASPLFPPFVLCHRFLSTD